MKKLALGLAVLLATSALAVQQLDGSSSTRLFSLIAGILITPRSLNNSDTLINANRITRALGGSATIDFASQTITCNTSTVSVLGARTGDPCFVGPPSTGGAANSSFTCYVSAADVVTIKHCPAGTASDPASATYSVRVLSAQ